MSKVIIDTNLIVVANRQNAEVAENCVLACTKFIIEARSNSIIIMDTSDEIRTEYAKALKTSKPMGLGALFLMHIFQHQFNTSTVQRVDFPKDESGEFIDFPKTPELADFDRDDRKFAALSKKTGVAVSTAIDTDWLISLEALHTSGISVHFLCGLETTRWFSINSQR
jgi:hypothetical protein